MKKLRVLVVVHASLIPPETLEGQAQKDIDEWRTEYDVTSTLRKMGHEVRCVGVLDSLTELRTTIADWKPDIVFNLLEEFDGIVTYDQHVVAFLELLRQPYTAAIRAVSCSHVTSRSRSSFCSTTVSRRRCSQWPARASNTARRRS